MCGWALASVLPPWVAQRVCAMPMLCPSEMEDLEATRLSPSAFSPSDAYLVTCGVERSREEYITYREKIE